MFWDQWECFLKNGLYHYDIIFVWVGNHSRISEDGKSHFTPYDYERFRADYGHLLRQCRQQCPQVIALSPLHMFERRKFNPVVEHFRRRVMVKPREVLDATENEVVEKKNEIMKEVARAESVDYHDVDAVMLKSKYWHDDNIHYIPQANPYIAELLKGFAGRDFCG